MTNKELQKLRRVELLEILVKISEENETLRAENKALKLQLEDRTVNIEESGSIAEAALKISGIFEAAQRAIDLYTENIEKKKSFTMDKPVGNDTSDSNKGENNGKGNSTAY